MRQRTNLRAGVGNGAASTMRLRTEFMACKMTKYDGKLVRTCVGKGVRVSVGGVDGDRTEVVGIGAVDVVGAISTDRMWLRTLFTLMGNIPMLEKSNLMLLTEKA